MTAPNAVNNPRAKVADLSLVRKNILSVAPLIQIIRTVIYGFSEAQGLSHVRVETLEPANWSKEVLDWRLAAGVQITLPGKAATLEPGRGAASRELAGARGPGKAW
jgi:hypothetical protein